MDKLKACRGRAFSVILEATKICFIQGQKRAAKRGEIREKNGGKKIKEKERGGERGKLGQLRGKRESFSWQQGRKEKERKKKKKEEESWVSEVSAREEEEKGGVVRPVVRVKIQPARGGRKGSFGHAKAIRNGQKREKEGDGQQGKNGRKERKRKEEIPAMEVMKIQDEL